ncbi:MAG: hypothetical protein IPK65_05315 [Gammaproteobacteria bacterium]|nr:hypothetical protein [Gammaproteobacteria bacterium]
MNRFLMYSLRACSAALCLGLAGAAPADPGAQDLGRLFTSRLERAEIDRMRVAQPRRPDEAAASGGTAAVPFAATRLDGMVRRSGGRDALWLNGYRTELDDGADARSRVRVTLPGTGRIVWMKPGQVFDPATGAVREAYQSGRAGP